MNLFLHEHFTFGDYIFTPITVGSHSESIFNAFPFEMSKLFKRTKEKTLFRRKTHLTPAVRAKLELFHFG